MDTLQKLVAQSRLEEFLLETRMKYLENQIAPVSPITTVTPLQNDVDEIDDADDDEQCE